MNSGDPAPASPAIAVIGLACRFPGCNSPEEFWANLRAGRETIARFSAAELAAAGVEPRLSGSPGYVAAKGLVQDADRFDAGFFGFSPREAAIMDPQQRVFLECAWAALEDAGCDPQRAPGAIGVFAGSILSTYLLLHVWPNRKLVREAGGFQAGLGNDPTFLASRVAYHLDLRGPSVSVGTACSTSLVAVHLACQSLLNRETDVALAGGVSIHLPLVGGYRYEEGSILAPDGHCRPFDAAAAGTVSSDGAGIVVLKRLEDALSDGDGIRAIIRGSAINSDGALKVGYTAPSVAGQARVIAEAMAMAGVEPDTISMIEAHGAGTLLGDPIEFAALREAFGDCGAKTGFCALGSVKSNLGHLDAAAGIAGLIKAVLALGHREIPATLHYRAPNPQIDLAASPFYVNAELQPMTGGGCCRAGVSSFGIGGTNCHVVLEEFRGAASAVAAPPSPFELLLFSARTPEALASATQRFAAHLDAHGEIDLADAAHTLRAGRRRFEHRGYLVCRGRDDALAGLREAEAPRLITGFAEETRGVAFMFPGLGDHYAEMGWHLYCTQPEFRRSTDESAALLNQWLRKDIRDFLFPGKNWTQPRLEPSDVTDAGRHPTLDLRAMLGRNGRKDSVPPPDSPALAQPGIFVIEVALATLLKSWGMVPSALIGHSIGEFAAACLSGIFSLEDALAVVAARAQLIEARVPAGAMLAISDREENLTSLFSSGVNLAAVNDAALCVASGEESGIRALNEELLRRGIPAQPLRSTHAYHSHMMTAIVPELTEVLRRVTLNPPGIPCISGVTGTWLTAQQATDPTYWARHLCSTIRFHAGLGTLFSETPYAVVEVGPGQGLSAHAVRERERRREGGRPVVPLMRWGYDRQSELAVLMKGVGQLWLEGVTMDLGLLKTKSDARRVPLPTYPFERLKYWIDAPGADATADDLEKKPDVADWFYLPHWKPSRPSGVSAAAGEHWLILGDENGVGAELTAILRATGGNVTLVCPGVDFEFGDHQCKIDLTQAAHYEALAEELGRRGALPRRIVHLWSLTSRWTDEPSRARFSELQETGFHSLARLSKALFRSGGLEKSRIDIIANGLFHIDGSDRLIPEKATLRALALVIPQEHPLTTGRVVDTDLPSDDAAVRATLIAQLLTELRGAGVEPAVAYRRGRRLVQAYEPVRFEGASEEQAPFRLRGSYLITGGLGGVGLVLARHLAQKVQARLTLVGRAPLPDRAAWDGWLKEHDEVDPTSRKIRQVLALEQLGAEVIVLSADVSDLPAMRRVFATIDERFGELHGVIHAAGNVGVETFREVVQLREADAEAQFGAKVSGLFVLDQLLGDRRLDFCHLTSSLSAVLGGLGFAAYSAANLFMDAFVAWKHSLGDRRWGSVNWESWVLPDAKPAIAGLGATVSNFGMRPEEGALALERALLNADAGSVVVSSGDLRARLRQWVEQKGKEPAASPLVRHARPQLRSKFTAPRGELEGSLAQIWQDLFAITQIGIHDNFFEIGGHSLLATQLNARIYARFGVEMSLATLLRNPTVAEQAVAIVAAQAEQANPAEIEALLSEMGAEPNPSPQTEATPIESAPRP